MSIGEFLLYTTEDGRSAIQLKATDGSVWLTQAEIAELFEVTPQAITPTVVPIAPTKPFGPSSEAIRGS